MVKENDPLDLGAEIASFAVARNRSIASYERWPQAKKDIIDAIVRHNMTPGNTAISLIGAATFLRSKGFPSSEGGVRNYCRLVLGIEWGAWP